jgi:hypothetical protein
MAHPARFATIIARAAQRGRPAIDHESALSMLGLRREDCQGGTFANFMVGWTGGVSYKDTPCVQS